MTPPASRKVNCAHQAAAQLPLQPMPVAEGQSARLLTTPAPEPVVDWGSATDFWLDPTTPNMPAEVHFDAINGRLEQLRGSVLGFRTLTTSSHENASGERRLQAPTTPPNLRSAGLDRWVSSAYIRSPADVWSWVMGHHRPKESPSR